MPKRLIGYARVSTIGQDLDYQLGKLAQAGCTNVFHEKKSGKNIRDRPELQAMLASLRQGDIVLATATDRIARDPLDLLNIMAQVKAADAGLRLIDEPFIDTTSEMSDLMMFLVGWAARWQRKRILENTAQGRMMAKERGVKFGRKSKLTTVEKAEALKWKTNGGTCRSIAEALGVSQSTISRLK